MTICWPARLSMRAMCAQVPAAAAVLALLYGVHAWLRARARVFLLDFACYKPPENLKITLDDFMTGSRDSKVRGGCCCPQLPGGLMRTPDVLSLCSSA